MAPEREAQKLERFHLAWCFPPAMSRSMMRRFRIPFLVLICWPSWADAQQVPIDPASTHIFPAGGQRGTVVAVRVGGECLRPLTHFSSWGVGIKSPAALGGRATGHDEPSLRRAPRETP